MSGVISDKYDSIIEGAFYAFFVTVRKDGMPTPTPVWFVRDGDTFIVYTTPGSQKLKNLEANPHVSLTFSPDYDADTYFAALGTARIDTSIPLAHQNSAYLAKYEKAMSEIADSPEALGNQYNVPIRIDTEKIRGLDWE